MNFAGVKSITIPEGDVKSVAIGGVTVWTKPNPLPYDAEVEYVESTGTQHIDTGVVLGETNRVVCGLQYTSVSGSAEQINGQSGADLRFAFGKASTSNRNFYAGLGGTNYWTNKALDTDYHEIDLDAPGKSVKIDDASWAVEWTAFASPSGVGGFLLFARANLASGSQGQYCYERIYHCDIYSSSALVRSYVPVRVGQTGYLYDRANPTGGPSGNGLYGSATSTPLVAGPDKNGGAA